jgi:ligand-binding sensor domain-containing protein/two-component sensor histidine kinase
MRKLSPYCTPHCSPHAASVVLAILTLVLAGSRPVRAQLLPIRNYTTKEGLNANGIYAILRDAKGVLWVGTYNGVNWYDGSRFIQPVMSTRSGQIYVTNFKQDSGGQVWVTSWYSGIYKFADGRFTNYLPDTVHIESQSNSVFDWLELGGGRYLAATDHNVWLFDGHVFRVFDSANTDLARQIGVLAKTARGDILIGYAHGVARYKKNGSRWAYAGMLLSGTEANKICIDGDKCWVAAGDGLWYYPDLSSALPGRPAIRCSHPGDGAIANIVMDREKNIWYTAATGVHKLNALMGNDQVYSKANGLPSTAVLAIFGDGEGITWLGTEYGLAKLNENDYRFLPVQEEDKGEANIISIGKDGENRIWLGSYQGLFQMDGAQAREVRYRDGRPTEAGSLDGSAHAGFAFSLMKDSGSVLWAGTGKGIYTIDGGVLRRRHPAQADCMAEDPRGVLWFGCMDGKILCYEKGGFREMRNPAYLDEKITAIYRDAGGCVWAGYAIAGIRKFRVGPDGGSVEPVKEYSARTGYANLRVRSFCDDGHGHLVAGTRTDGLYIFDLGQEDNETGVHRDTAIIHINIGKGLSGNWVKAAVCHGRELFLATNNGLDILDPGDYKARPRHIAFSNDAVPTEFNTVFLQGDTVWLGTSKGVLQYMPRQQQKNRQPPPVYIMKVTIDGGIDSNFQPFSAAGDLSGLSYRQNSIAFDFAGLSFLDEENVRYRYRMDGLDKDWSAITDRRYVNYSHLSPGKYQFRVIAQNGDGVWSAAPATLAFMIATPFWQSWWFIILSFGIVGGLIFALYRNRLQQALQIERLRVKISTDLHDDIGSTLSSISILSEIVLREVGGDPRSGMVREIKERSISLMEKMDDIVWSINPRNDELESLMLRIKRFAAQLFEAKGIDYEIDIEHSILHLKLPMEHRQNIYLIMKEAINNLVKYADAGKAFIKAESAGQFLRVQISDDGKGLQDEQMRRGNGIFNMKSRAGLMGAELRVDSIAGKGVTVILTLKMR